MKKRIEKPKKKRSKGWIIASVAVSAAALAISRIRFKRPNKK